MKTEHNLEFYAAPFEYDPKLVRFKVGTCHGLYGVSNIAYELIAIMNDNPGNGHLTDVLQWFENSAKRDKKELRVVEIWNEGFFKHLTSKRGFVPLDPMNVVKRFTAKGRIQSSFRQRKQASQPTEPANQP